MKYAVNILLFSLLIFLTSSCTGFYQQKQQDEEVRIFSEDYSVDTERVTEAANAVQFSLEEIGYECDPVEVRPRLESYTCIENIDQNINRILQLRFFVYVGPTSTLTVQAERVKTLDPTMDNRFGIAVDMSEQHINQLKQIIDFELENFYTKPIEK